MPAEYRKVSVQMWADARFRSLGSPLPSAQFLWFFLLTGPHTGRIPGLSCVGEAQLAETLRWPVRDLRRCWEELVRAGFSIEWDRNERVMWLPNAIKYNPPESPNVVRYWAKALPLIPDCELRSRALVSLGNGLLRYGRAFAIAFREAFREALQKGFPEGSKEGFDKGFMEGFPEGFGEAFREAFGESVTVTVTNTPPSPPLPGGRRRRLTKNQQHARLGAAKEPKPEPQRQQRSVTCDPPPDEWPVFLRVLKESVPPPTADTWFAPMEFVTLELCRGEADGPAGRKVVILVPNEAWSDWIPKQFDSRIRSALREVGWTSYRLLEREFVPTPAEAHP